MKTAGGAPCLLLLLLGVGLLCLGAHAAPPQRGPAITLDYVRDAIVSLVRVMHDTGDKLERHEYRERQLGEQLKKSLANLGKRAVSTDAALDSLASAIAILDDRMRRSEQEDRLREERQAEQLRRLQAGLERLESWQKVAEEALRSQNKVQASSEEDGPAAAKAAEAAARLAHAVDRLEARVAMEQAATERPCAPAAAAVPAEWRSEVLEALESQRSSLEETRRLAGAAAEGAREARHAVHRELEKTANATLERLEDVRRELAAVTYKTAGVLEGKLADVRAAAAQDHEEVVRAVSEGNQAAETLFSGVTASYEQLRSEVQALAKVERVLIQTADNVLDTKRRIEYGVHQILLQVGDTVKIHSKDLNNTFNRRFDDISATILDNQTGALANLSSKIEQEISQVWRQIGTMYNQLSASTTALDRLQQQTEQYVNGSLHTMDSMEGKVGEITSRMSVVDDNLNYLLKRLAFVGSEFNDVKQGLGEALENIRSSFLEAQNKIKELSPGPHEIPDRNLNLGQQNAK
ncbi:myosin-7B [Schistocerca gregaria]|uniref:myosin-7B n=1 Tax=Schistocerca gregaria TaxID=7010 RepID=UPI00211DBACE|nr:myosin-7B [Schistocerca gregaria]XP_049851539.1 myosin-7B [Schistocerca gregaria]